jgi:hypothetical protein
LAACFKVLPAAGDAHLRLANSSGGCDNAACRRRAIPQARAAFIGADAARFGATFGATYHSTRVARSRPHGALQSPTCGAADAAASIPAQPQLIGLGESRFLVIAGFEPIAFAESQSVAIAESQSLDIAEPESVLHAGFERASSIDSARFRFHSARSDF